MSNSLSKVADRQVLKPRRDPYWQRVRKGCYLGFRKMAPGSEGTWIGRARDELAEKQLHCPLGDFSHLPVHQRFDAALLAAEVWFGHLEKGGTNEVATVKRACEAYVEHLREANGERAAHDAEMRFQRWVYTDAKLAGSELGKLRPEQIQNWRSNLKRAVVAGPMTAEGKQRQRSESSLNRDMTALRAALNRAYDDGLTTSDHAWRTKLVPVKNADARRDIYLDRDQRRALIAHASPDIAQFLRGLSVLPLRPGALAALTVASFDARLGALTVGKDKQGQDRKISLPASTAAFMKEMSKGKLPGAPLFSRTDGKAWDKDAWKYPVKRAAQAAGLPENVVAYALRHSAITDLVHAGLDTLTVAQLSGTSVAMIEKHYGHLKQEHARQALATLAL